jgi:hypothetical protein
MRETSRRTYIDLDAYEIDDGMIVVDRSSRQPWPKRHIVLSPEVVDVLATLTSMRQDFGGVQVDELYYALEARLRVS